MLEPMAGGCRCEIESAKDADLAPGYDTLNRAWLVTSLLVLGGFPRTLGIACSAYPWDLIAGHQERTKDSFKLQLSEEGPEAAVHRPRRALPRFQGGLLDYHLHLCLPEHNQDAILDEAIAEWCRNRFDQFNRLASESESFHFALQAAIDWRYTKDARTAVARLWSGIEAVFGISSELVYRISLLAASLLEPRGTARRQRFSQVKKLYGLRSKAVHGDKLTNEQLRQAVNESFFLIRDLLLLAIEKGHALTDSDFDTAVFE